MMNQGKMLDIWNELKSREMRTGRFLGYSTGESLRRRWQNQIKLGL